MRKTAQARRQFLAVLDLNAAMAADHPLAATMRHVDAILKKRSPMFDELYEQNGRLSIPPEQRLKLLLQSVLSRARSERHF